MFSFIFGTAKQDEPPQNFVTPVTAVTAVTAVTQDDPLPIVDTAVPDPTGPATSPLPCHTIKIRKHFKKQRHNYMYVVIKKVSGDIIGVYNSLDLAKLHGQNSTYFDCSIYKIKINALPSYLHSPVFEN